MTKKKKAEACRHRHLRHHIPQAKPCWPNLGKGHDPHPNLREARWPLPHHGWLFLAIGEAPTAKAYLFVFVFVCLSSFFKKISLFLIKFKSILSLKKKIWIKRMSF